MKRAAVLLLRVSIAALFAYAGIAKALDPGAFAVELGNYRLLPALAEPSLAYYVPWLEIVCAAALFARPFRAGAWLVLAGLAAAFVVFVTSAWIRGIDVSCGCFGGGGRPIDALTVARTALVLTATCAGFALDRPRCGSAGTEENRR